MLNDSMRWRLYLRGLIVAVAACGLLTACDQKDQDKHGGSAASEQSASSAAYGGVKLEKVRTEGTGTSFDDALTNALTLAVGQVNGTEVSKRVQMQGLAGDYHAQTSGRYSAGGNSDAQPGGIARFLANFRSRVFEKSASSVDFRSDEKIVTGSTNFSGFVRRFQVVEQRHNKSGWRVAIVAEIPVYQASTASKRLRIAVLPFRLARDGKSDDAFERTVRSQLIDALSLSGKVAVLDRDYTQENQDEIVQLFDASFSKTDAARLGNRLGADYIVVGTVAKTSVKTDSVYMSALGRRVYGATHAEGRIAYRVIEAATGVVQLSGTIGGASGGSNLEAVAKREADAVSARILDTLYPLRVISVSNGIFYLSRGSGSLQVGDMFRVLRRGRPLTDPDTHEVVGYDEREIAQIVVSEVNDHVSKARLSSGANIANGNVSDLVARPVGPENGAASSSAAAAPTARTKTVKKRATPAESSSKEGVDY